MGGAGSQNFGGFGGPGREWPAGSGVFYAGGGAGGSYDGALASGGRGGGGRGGQLISAIPGIAGTANTGGGGGASLVGGAGGSGIVVIRYIIETAPVFAQTRISDQKINKFETTTFRPVAAIDGARPYSYSVSPALPSGLTLNSATGVISGIPTQSVTAKQFTVTVADSNLDTASSVFSLTTTVGYLYAVDLVVNRTLFIETINSLAEVDRTVADILPSIISIKVNDDQVDNRLLKYGIVLTLKVNENFVYDSDIYVTDAAIINVDTSYENLNLGAGGDLEFNYGKLDASVFQSQQFLSSGVFTWTVPQGVTSVNIVAVGGGGGGSQKSTGGQGGSGGALAYDNNVAVVPGETYTVIVGVGGATGGAYGSNGQETILIRNSTEEVVLFASGGTGGDNYNWRVKVHPSTINDSTQTFDYSLDRPGAITYTLVDAPAGFAINSSTGTVTYTKQNVGEPTTVDLTVLALAPNSIELIRTDEITINVFAVGQIDYATPGTYTFIIPPNVTAISAMAVGGGGAGDDGNSGDGGGGGGSGGSAGYFNNLAVTPGQSMTIVVGAGGAATTAKNTKAPNGGLSSVSYSTFTMSVPGGIGGSPYTANPGAAPPAAPTFSNAPVGLVTAGFQGGGGGAGFNGGGGGGGAAGLQGVGGNGSRSSSTSLYSTELNGVGGGGGGGGANIAAGISSTSGGKSSGSGGAGQNDVTGGGGGGSVTYSNTVLSTGGGNGNGLSSAGSKGGDGGFPGGGGGGSWDSNTGLSSSGGGGFVRLVWGTLGGARQFPNNAGDA
jgi:hypothetical protein